MIYDDSLGSMTTENFTNGSVTRLEKFEGIYTIFGNSNSACDTRVSSSTSVDVAHTMASEMLWSRHFGAELTAACTFKTASCKQAPSPDNTCSTCVWIYMTS